jgi:nicotinamidase-related amidase
MIKYKIIDIRLKGDGDLSKEPGALVIIDPQNDFCDRGGSLYVDGAEGDIARLASHISRDGARYSDIFVSLDSHDAVAIFHPKFWLDESGGNPAPFTALAESDYRAGFFRVACPAHTRYAEKMFEAMAEKNVPSLMVWPEHCLVSTWGHRIADVLLEALSEWQVASRRPVRYVFKGENPYTEQFSIFEGLDGSWPETAFNEGLYASLAVFPSVTFAGEALSHCVAESVASYVKRGGGSAGAQKKYVLSDCTSPVLGFERSEYEGRLAALGVAFARTDG